MKSNWLANPAQECVGILMPPFFALALVFVFPHTGEIHPWTWLVLVVCVDVAHVYSTIFRTYWSVQSRQLFGDVLWIVPLICLIGAVWLHMYSTLWFWRLLAYAAVWHFVRQQYGFLRLYQRREHGSKNHQRLGIVTIYAATLYPLFYWHCSPDREFHWMIDGDFFHWSACPWIVEAGMQLIYWSILATYVLVEIVVSLRNRHCNIPKNILVLGTFVSWYFGIVYFNGDWAFTALNVLSHGLPYLTLIWISDGHHITEKRSLWRMMALYFGVILALAIAEETMWDVWVWRDHPVFFEWLYPESGRQDRTWLNIIVPLLALPQLVHYVLDGFIWKRKQTDAIVQKS